jgi:hypothetical protein
MRRNRTKIDRDPGAIPIMQLVCQLIVGLLKKPGYAADLTAIFSATLVSATARMKRRVRSTKATLSAPD